MTNLAYGYEIEPGRAGYATGSALGAAWKAGRAAQAWLLGPRIVSLRLTKGEGGGMWKQVERLPTLDPTGLLDALAAMGIPHPSSYADTYHSIAAPLPPIRHTYNGMFSWWPGGPWSEALRIGVLAGPWWRYDLISAYRWAATLGLPDPQSFAVTRSLGTVAGLWVCTIKGTRPDLPPCFRGIGPVVLSTEEIEQYKVRVEVHRGVTWTSMFPRDYVEHTLRRLPCAKDAGRAYWGRWIAKDPLRCWTPSREWNMRNVFANFVWGWLIVGRVRSRLWEVAANAAHCYVDEVLVPHQLPTSDALGGWHCKEIYPKGIRVVRTGAYGPLGQSLTMSTGSLSA
jgi:hypothetical protein